MNKGIRRFISCCVAVLILFSMTFPAYAQFSDASASWAATVIDKWVGKGIIQGYPDGTYRPDNSISRAEFSNVINKVFNFVDKIENAFSDVSSKSWYYDVVSRVAAAGVISGYQGRFRPDDPISRQEAAAIISRAFKLKVKDSGAANKFVDSKDIEDWAKDAIDAMAENGYIAGHPGNKFAPLDDITRAEAIKIIDNIIQDIKGAAGTYTGTFEKSLVVNAGGITLKDAIINGDLILAQGIAGGTVNLDNVRVKGRTVVLGGGENSIILNNTSLEGTLMVIKIDGKVRIVAKGSTAVADVALNSGAKLEEDGVTGEGFANVEIIEIAQGQQVILDGDFADVSVEASGAAVQIVGGSVGNLNVASGISGTSVQIAADATVTTLTANASVNVTGKGRITTANINAEGVAIEQKPANTKVASGITATVGGSQVTGSTSTTTPTNSGSSGTASYISSINMTTVSGGSIPGACSSSTYTFDLTSASLDTYYINGLQINSTPAADRLVVSDVSTSNAITGANGLFNLTGNDSIVNAFFGVGFEFDGNISVQTIKSIFSGSITRNVAVYSGSTLIKDIVLTVKITDDDYTLGAQNLLNCYTLSAADGTVTATLKSGKENEPVLTGTAFYQLLRNMITIPEGYSYQGVNVDGLGYTTDSITILQNLKTAAGGLNEMTLGDLKAGHVTVSVMASKPGSINRVVTVIFN